MTRTIKATCLALALLAAFAVGAKAADPPCRRLCPGPGPLLSVATGSPGELGLLAELARAFCADHKVSLCWRKAGSGLSLRLLKEGKVDVALVHAPAAEEKAVAAGWAADRTLIGGNRFYLVGPPSDPAGAAGAKSAAEAYARIARAKAPFITRADGSGTNKREMALWKQAGVSPSGSWYIPSHDFMMASLRLADKKGAYFMTDSSTWVVGRALHGLKGLKVLRAADPDLVNGYHALRRAKGGHAPGPAREFIAFLASPAGQRIVTGYGRHNLGQALYEPAAKAAHH